MSVLDGESVKVENKAEKEGAYGGQYWEGLHLKEVRN